jgi:hypothetical protein
MEKIQVGEVTLFKQAYLGDAENLELFGVSNESGVWVSLNDIVELLGFGSNKKKRMRKYTNENDLCKIFVERSETSGKLEEYFIRDSVVYDIILADRKERLLTEHFIFDVLSQLNGDLSYDPEAELIKEYLCDAIDNDALIDFTIDESRMYYSLLYDDYDDSGVVMTKKENLDGSDKVQYKKVSTSTCPAWLRSVVK